MSNIEEAPAPATGQPEGAGGQPHPTSSNLHPHPHSQPHQVRTVLSAWERWNHRQLEDVVFSPIKLVPRWVLADGDGDRTSGFKSEWSAVQGDCMVVGSHGYEVWPSVNEAGWEEFPGHRPLPPPLVGSGLKNVQFIKKINLNSGGVSHVDWSRGYNAISSALGVTPPG